MGNERHTAEDSSASYKADVTVPRASGEASDMGSVSGEQPKMGTEAPLRGSLGTRNTPLDSSGELSFASSDEPINPKGTPGVPTIRRRGRSLRVASSVALCVVVTFCLLLLQMFQVMSLMPGTPVTGASASVASDSPGKAPQLDIDYEGLSEMFGSESEDDETGSSAEWEEWADRLIYYQLWNYKNQWPIPNGCTHPQTKCYDCSGTHALCLLTGDFTLTPDIVMKEAYEYWHKGQGELIYPWDIARMYKEKYKLVCIRHKNSDVPKKDMVKIVKEGLEKGHVFEIGPGNWYPFYTHNGNTRIPGDIGGHAVLFYKYEDGVYWAKDSSIGPMVPYPEQGGAIDVNEWIRNSGDRIGFEELYIEGSEEGTVRPQIKKPESYQEVEHPVNVMKNHPLIPESLRQKYANSRLSGYSSPKASSSSGKDSSSDVTPSDSTKSAKRDSPGGATPQAEGTKDDKTATLAAESVSAGGTGITDGTANPSRIVAAAGDLPSVGSGRSAEWALSVLRKAEGLAEDATRPETHGYQLYGTVCEHTTASDPARSTLRPGMLIGVPITNGGTASERIDGHFGIYLGDGQVAHDTGKVEVTSLGDFIARYGDCCDVGWGEAAANDDGYSQSPASEQYPNAMLGESVTIPMPASHGVASEESIKTTITGHLLRECPGKSLSSVTLMGNWDMSPGEGDSQREVGASYLISFSDGTRLGLVVTCDGMEKPVVTECRYLWVTDGVFYDTQGGEYLQMEENEWLGTDWDEMERLIGEVAS